MKRSWLALVVVAVWSCGPAPAVNDAGTGGGSGLTGGGGGGGGGLTGGGGGSTGGGGGEDAGSDAGTPTDAGGEDASVVTTLYFNPATGLDTNDCSPAARCKTISHGVRIAKSGQTLLLSAGTYDSTSGETFDAGVPDGITIEADDAGGRPVIVGTNLVTAFEFSGGATLRNLDVASASIGINAHGGVSKLEGMRFVGTGTALVLDSTAHVDAVGIDVNDGGRAFDLRGIAELAIADAGIAGMGPNCSGGAGIGDVADSALVEMTNMSVHDNFGDLFLRSSSRAVLTNVTLVNNGFVGCGGVVAMTIADAASLQMTDTNISSTNGTSALDIRGVASVYATRGRISRGIENEHGRITLNQVEIVGMSTDPSIRQYGSGALVLNGADIHGATSNDPAVSVYSGSLTLNGAIIHDNVIGLEVNADQTQVRMDVTANRAANTIRNNSTVGFRVSGTSNVIVNAAGNNWTPSRDLADAQGHMSAHLVTGPYQTTGGNIFIYSAGPKIQF